MKKGKKDFFKIIVLIIILITLLIFNYTTYRIRKEQSDMEKAQTVLNFTEFYTVQNCANKFIHYLKKGNLKDINLIIDKSQRNKIKKKTIDKYSAKINRDLIWTYRIDEMKFLTLTNNKTKFYLKGNIIVSDMYNDHGNYQFNMQIILNKPNRTFSVLMEDINEIQY